MLLNGYPRHRHMQQAATTIIIGPIAIYKQIKKTLKSHNPDNNNQIISINKYKVDIILTQLTYLLTILVP